MRGLDLADSKLAGGEGGAYVRDYAAFLSLNKNIKGNPNVEERGPPVRIGGSRQQYR